VTLLPEPSFYAAFAAFLLLMPILRYTWFTVSVLVERPIETWIKFKTTYHVLSEFTRLSSFNALPPEGLPPRIVE